MCLDCIVEFRYWLVVIGFWHKMNNRRSKIITQALQLAAVGFCLLCIIMLIPVLILAVPAGSRGSVEPERPWSLHIKQELSDPLYSIYVSGAGTEQWGHDLLGIDVLLPGESSVLDLPEVSPVDILLIDSVGHRYHYADIDIRDGYAIAVHNADRLRTTGQQQGFGWVNIINSVGVPLRSVYVSPSGAKTWGGSMQLLSEYSLLQQDSSQYAYIEFSDSSTFFFDFLAEDYYGNQYVLWDVNIMLHSRIEFRIQHIR